MNELTGGLRNAMEYGSSLEEAKQSFLNAGYKSEEVEKAAGELSQKQAPQKTESRQMAEEKKELPVIKEAKETSKWMIIAIIAILVLIGAGLVGIFWDKIFG